MTSAWAPVLAAVVLAIVAGLVVIAYALHQAAGRLDNVFREFHDELHLRRAERNASAPLEPKELPRE